METDDRNNLQTIESLLTTANKELNSIDEQLANIKKPSRLNFEYSPPGASSNRYSIHIESQERILRDKREQVKQNYVADIINSKCNTKDNLQIDDHVRGTIERLKPASYNKTEKNPQEMQAKIQFDKLNKEINPPQPEKKASETRQNKFYSRMDNFIKGGRDITKDVDRDRD
ncbi:MAG: hypothetical protein BWY67_00596 [Bacteroidetes bacterium ADurb.Bin397]|jgi:hypothetical protein|nr:MAG: hypothetical protein BWY67_00596 [Bacteroidetes bacterium ADurb.Bin397]